MKLSIAAMCLVLAAAPAARADTIIQQGNLSGGLGQQLHEITLEQFDTMGGSRQLNFVQLDFQTSVIGGYQTDGSGTPVDILAELATVWSFQDEVLAETTALIDTTVANTSAGSFTVFDPDAAQVFIDDPAGLSPWIGAGGVILHALTTFTVSEDPAGIINFGAGGSVSYTVLYDYTVVPGPSAAAALLAVGVLGGRRRSRDGR